MYIYITHDKFGNNCKNTIDYRNPVKTKHFLSQRIRALTVSGI